MLPTPQMQKNGNLDGKRGFSQTTAQASPFFEKGKLERSNPLLRPQKLNQVLIFYLKLQ